MPSDSKLDGSAQELPSLRYSLRHLFWIVTLLCVLLAALVATAGSGVAPLALLLAVLVVILHVTGTALGTRLRAHADSQNAPGTRPVSDTPQPVAPTLRRSLLHRRGHLNRWLRIWVAAGVSIGALAGALLLALAIGHRATLAGIAVGTISTAILGGWFAFLAVSTWAIFRDSWRDAVADPTGDDANATDSTPPRKRSWEAGR